MKKSNKDYDGDNQTVIVVEAIDVNDVISLGETRFNSSAHFSHTKGPPVDYIDRVERTHSRYWINCLKSSYRRIDIDLKRPGSSWIYEAVNIGIHTGEFPHSFEDEFEIFLAFIEHETDVKDVFDGSKYFIRSNEVSLREGKHGVGPYVDIKNVIESVVTCKASHRPINEDTKVLTIYCIPWVEIHPNKEFRMFVHENRVTAISQQHLRVRNEHLADISSSELRDKVLSLNLSFSIIILASLSKYLIFCVN